MGWEFHSASGLGEYVDFDPSSFSTTLAALIKSRHLIVLGDPPVGMAGLFTVPAFYNANVKMAGEVFWWVNPEHRGRGIELMDALEERARELGASVFHMSCLENIRPELMGRFYRRQGYAPVDHLYYKVL